MPQTAPNANIKIVPSTMVTPYDPQAGSAFTQLSSTLTSLDFRCTTVDIY
jgi:hypothetical protein